MGTSDLLSRVEPLDSRAIVGICTRTDHRTAPSFERSNGKPEMGQADSVTVQPSMILF
jgi:hypothetical protein